MKILREETSTSPLNKPIIACVKLSIDPLTKFEVINDHLVIDDPIFPFRQYFSKVDHCVLEEAIRLGEESKTEVIAITVGPGFYRDMLKRCIARGVNRAIHINLDNLNLDALNTAYLLSKKIETLMPGMVICGQSSVDYANGVIGPYLAGLLQIPQLTNVRKIEMDWDTGKVTAHRQMEQGNRYIMESDLPAVLCVTDAIISPQYFSVKKYINAPDSLVEEVIPKRKDLPYKQKVQVLQDSYPKPRARKLAMPDATLSASERMKFMMSGGVQKEQSSIYTGSASGAVDRLIKTLQEQGFL